VTDAYIFTRALVIKPDTDVARLVHVNRDLASWKRLVGGPIESLALSDTVWAYINEDGKAQGLPVNLFGDQFVRASLARIGRRLWPGDHITGPLVLKGPPDRDGWDTDVPDQVLAEVRALGMTVEDETTGEGVTS
jgi:hypothetical protein